jgi:iron complex transport system substrate-binding protein
MNIISLLPSATEIVYSLGLGQQLVGVSYDCDFPPDACGKPVVSLSALNLSTDSSPESIDREVRASLGTQESIYRVDRQLVRELQPDLILAQDLCRVCAVPSGHVTEALESLGCEAEVISLDPATLDDVLDGIQRVAEAAGRHEAGLELIAQLRSRIGVVRAVSDALPKVRTFALEWADPPFTGGHWVPEMIRLAGGRDVLGIERAASRQCAWEEIAAAAPDVVVFMPCGFGLQDALAQAEGLASVAPLRQTPAWRTGQVWAVDGSAYFSRPGPRLVDGLEILAWILHPDVFAEPPPGRVQRITTL